MNDEQQGHVVPEPLTAEERSDAGLRTFARRHLALFVGIGICFAFAISIYSFLNANDRRRSACIDLEALKTITRNEKNAQIAKTDRILKRHPEGPIFGIPRKLLEESNDEQRQIVKQLAPKDC